MFRPKSILLMKRLNAFVPLPPLPAALPNGCDIRAATGAGAIGLVDGEVEAGDDVPGDRAAAGCAGAGSVVGDFDASACCSCPSLAGRCGERDTLRKDGRGDGMAGLVVFD